VGFKRLTITKLNKINISHFITTVNLKVTERSRLGQDVSEREYTAFNWGPHYNVFAKYCTYFRM
jgi:hypothetical protein